MNDITIYPIIFIHTKRQQKPTLPIATNGYDARSDSKPLNTGERIIFKGINSPFFGRTKMPVNLILQGRYQSTIKTENRVTFHLVIKKKEKGTGEL